MDSAVPRLIGVSAELRSVEDEIECAACSDAKVLITGESGVGKEVVAHLIHHRSRRGRGPLVTINCAGIPDTLLASELFGHMRGSFTDAYRDRRGWIEQAQGGTIFMDEIGEMSGQMQALLLRFLESGEIQPVGADRCVRSTDVRVITATNRKLTERVAAREFRADLFYRLNVIHIEIPPLRQRREDVPVLLAHFLRHVSADHRKEPPTLNGEALAHLVAYDWPGNVRQLRNVVERLVVRSSTGVITPADLPRETLSLGSDVTPLANALVAPSRVEVMLERMVQKGEPFWTVVHEPFMARDLTRDELRQLVRRGLELTQGDCKLLTEIFNLSPDDDRRLLSFLRKQQCDLAIQEFRPLPARRDRCGGAMRVAAAS